MINYLKRYWREGIRWIMIVIVLHLVVISIIEASAIRDSTINKPQNYVRHSGTDVFVALKGVTDYVSNSAITSAQLEEIRQTPGVQKVQGTILSFASLQLQSKNVSIVVQSFDPASGFGGPWQLGSGHSVMQDGQAVVDESLAHNLKLHLGDTVSLGSGSFKTVGLSQGTSSIGKQLVFVTTHDAQRYLLQGNGYTHAQVTTQQPRALANRISRLDMSAYTRSQFVKQNHDYWYKQIGPAQNEQVVRTALFGAIIMLIILWVAAWMRRRSLAMLSALGVSPWRLIWEEWKRTSLLIAFFFLGAVFAAYVWIGGVNHQTAGLDAVISGRVVIQTAIIMAVVSILAQIPSSVSIFRTDPAVVLREAQS